MDQDELQRMVTQHDEAINEMRLLLQRWLPATHGAVKGLFEAVDSLFDGSLEVIETLERLSAARNAAEGELVELRKLHEQFEAVQEIFGTRLARAREISPPTLSVIKGGADESSS